MTRRLFLLTWLLAAFFNARLLSQSRVENKNSFYDAEASILFEDYKEALPQYLKLIRIYPNNSNLKYRIGQCYINTPGEKDKAMTYLENAVKNINPKYKEGKFTENGAPYDALYYLANAYRINNMLDKALETYEIFKKNLNTTVYDTAVVNLQIQSCLNAKTLMAKPLFIKEKNVGNMINEGRSELNPVVSDNEGIIVFARNEALYNALYYSVKVNGEWSGPINMNGILRSDIPELVDRDLYPTSLSKDGKDLYLYSSKDYDGIIFTTRFENGNWSPLIRLNDNINTKFWESHATISHDNNKLYFTSNRKGTIGGLDIYISKRDTTGNWGPAVNLGPVINTLYNEESPFLSNDDKTLFFSSLGHYNMGGYDVFYSTLMDNGEWSVPLNVGYPINTTDDDVFFKPENDGYEGYIAKDLPGGFGNQDIYRIEIFTNDHPRKFFVRGMVKITDLLSSIKDSVRISAKDLNDSNKTYVVYSDPVTGEYELHLPQGNYQVTFDGKGVEKSVKNIELPISNPSDSFVLPGTILPKTDFVADFQVDAKKSISVAKGDTILFPLRTEKNSFLSVEHWVGDSLLSVEKFFMTDTLFTYKMVPSPGDNKVVFKLTDKFNNTTTTDVFITRKKDEPEQLLIRPEYSRVIAKKQAAALAAVLLSRSGNKLSDIIKAADTENMQFSRVDDLISFLKDEAARKSISPEEVDRLALQVAVMDNILTQAAVDLMAKHTLGELKNILTDLNIYDSNLKTWTDLQAYILSKTNGRITPEELNKIAAAVLAGIDPEIAILREKILDYSETSEFGSIIRESVSIVDISNIKLKEQWLQAFFKKGLTNSQISQILAAISSLPTTDVEQFLRNMIEHSEEPLTSALKTIDLKKEKIKTIQDLIFYLLTSKDKNKFPEDAISKIIADIVSTENIPADIIKSKYSAGKDNKLWNLWIVFGAGLLFYIIYLYRKKNKK